MKLPIVAIAVALVACNTKADPAGKAPPAPHVTAEPDHVVVLARHKPARPTDPVAVHIDRFKVVTASFDPKNLEGGKATIALDLTSVHTDSSERDDDLKSPSYIDVGKFATATIDIANVKTKSGKTFTADATVSLRGATKTYPVTFDVIDQTDHSITIKGEHSFSRLDFTVGSDPATDAQQQVDPRLTIQMVVTLERG
jgi:polyisoprenoid-binding protein YceI